MDINEINANSLKELLNLFYPCERIEKNTQYKCESCKKDVIGVMKKMSFEEAPFTLCIYLKRFVQQKPKLQNDIEMPEFIDLSQYSTMTEPLQYRLSSLMIHQ